MSEDEAQLVAVHVPDAGHHPLVEQSLGQRAVRMGDQVGGRDPRIPVAAKQIGAEMGDRVLVVVALENLQHAEVDACGLDVGGFQNDADAVARAARPLGGLTCQLPSIFRCEWMLASPTRMNRCLPRLTTSSTRCPVRSTVA